MDNDRSWIGITTVGAIANVLLAAAKTTVGVIGGSAALVADGIHSLSDLVSDAFVVFGVTAAQRPPDDNHAFGHGRYETISALFVALLLLIAGGAIGWHGTTRILRHVSGEPVGVPRNAAIFVALVSIGVKEALFHATRAVGRRTNRQLLIANAWHHRTDALSSVAAFIGISGAVLLGRGWTVLDPIVAVMVSFLVVVVGVRTGVEALREMTDHALTPEECDELFAIIKTVPGVTDPHNLKTRRLGPNVAVEVHFRVPGGMSVSEAHIRATEIESQIRRRFGEASTVITHVEPTIDQR